MTHTSVNSGFTSQPLGFLPVANSPQLSATETPSEAKTKHDRRSLPSLPILPATHVWGIDYSVVNMAETLNFIDLMIERGEPNYAITANLNYAMLCSQHPRLAAFTQRCKLVLCDGMPIFWRSMLNKRKLPERVAGSDLIYALTERSAQRGYRMFLMGGDEGVAQEAANKLQQMYPGLTIAGVECPPFRKPTQEEHQQLCQRIRRAKPDILLVAFGQPKGEFWIEDNYQSLGIPLCIQLGASFDFIVGKAQRAPVWMQRFGFEWLFRACTDPKRLLPRYIQNTWFLLKAIRQELLHATK